MKEFKFTTPNEARIISEIHYPAWLFYLIITAILFTYLSSISAGIIRLTNSESTCSSLIQCFYDYSVGNISTTNIGLIHELISILALTASFMAIFFFLNKLQIERFRKYLYSLGFGSIAGIILFNLATETRKIGFASDWVNTFHLIFMMLLEANLIFMLVMGYKYNKTEQNRDSDRKNILTIKDQNLSLNLREPFNKLTILALLSVIFLFLTGGIIQNLDLKSACTGWPLCNGFKMNFDTREWINIIHRGSVILSGALISRLFVHAWQKKREQTVELVAVTSIFILFSAQALMGALLTTGFPIELLVLHQATAAVVWIVFFVVIAMMIFSEKEQAKQHVPILSLTDQIKRIPEFLKLTKPVVVMLLLVTTFTGMVIAGQKWPPFNLVFWTLLGGFLAAGGSGAVNQYIDRFDDTKMQRTQSRPIPSGRITPSESLAFGVALLTISFYVLTAFVNLLAALLTLAGIIYYVLVYSIILKKTTVQNIVIGGGAGAIPPLVGWAAVTQSLNIPSLFLFGIIFMWTPPHFWALALVRKKDYARAGVPMLPVIRGEKETRWQILLYTIQLVILTLLLPLFGLGSSIYLIGAVILGVWLLMAAWKVWKIEGNKVAWKMYRYSSMYLAFLFILLMIDRLIL